MKTAKAKTGGPWSKATAEQREHHRRRCQAAGEWTRKRNFVGRICTAARKIGIDGLELMQLYYMLDQNGKFPPDDVKTNMMLNLLMEKKPAAKVYQEMFGCQA